MFHVEDLLFTGDGLVTMDLLGSSRGPQHMQPVFDVDTDRARLSLNRIVGLDAGTILPGHGDPWVGTPREAVAIARA
jgi:glyoxylase-like metal-dependent hydrolase (beta-lactamase superfamily II)